MRNTFQNGKTQDQKNQTIQQKMESETKKKTNQSKKQPQETKWLQATTRDKTTKSNEIWKRKLGCRVNPNRW